ncbi:MAG: hypothetical protein FJ222_12535 [Lentisphaerae bacterium]|nr:hypothetical protein [Lentisphaerota bacterium]
MAVGLAEELPIEEAARRAVRAASISVTRPGAQASMPFRHRSGHAKLEADRSTITATTTDYEENPPPHRLPLSSPVIVGRFPPLGGS